MRTQAIGSTIIELACMTLPKQTELTHTSNQNFLTPFGIGFGPGFRENAGWYLTGFAVGSRSLDLVQDLKSHQGKRQNQARLLLEPSLRAVAFKRKRRVPHVKRSGCLNRQSISEIK